MAVEFFVMGFLAEVKMRGDGVLEQMDQKIADQHKYQRLLAAEANRFRNHFDERHGQHVPGAKSQKILQHSPRPVVAYNEVTADEIASSRHQSQSGSHAGAKCEVVIHPEETKDQPLCRNNITSPSCTT